LPTVNEKIEKCQLLIIYQKAKRGFRSAAFPLSKPGKNRTLSLG
jgi:hypothetical protein